MKIRNRFLCRVPALLAVALAAIPPALAGAHTWDVNEVFSNADGSIQFIELREQGGGANEVGLNNKTVSSNTNAFTVVGNLTSPTSFRHLLFATPAFAALPGAPAPDYLICPAASPCAAPDPDRFFALGGDTIRYHIYDVFTFGPGQLPTDGINSLNKDFTTGVNSPTNYAGDTGSVDASPGPPAVPNGEGGTTPMTAVPVDPGADSITIAWDTSTCQDPPDHHIIYGQGSQLPLVPGGPFAQSDVDGDETIDPLGSVCNIGAVSPFEWSGLPVPTDGTGLLWWILVVPDGSKEGSWGRDSSGLERVGPGTNGSSDQCGAVDKDARNICGG